MNAVKRKVIIHEVGHLLFTLKYIFTPSNINSIKCIYADKNGGYFNHADLLMPDKYHLMRVLGGAAMDVFYDKVPYCNLTQLYVIFFSGWQHDIAQCLEHGYSWREVKKTIWRLSKEITDKDKQFVDEIVGLYKGNTKTLKMDKLFPIINKFYPKFSEYYESI